MITEAKKKCYQRFGKTLEIRVKKSKNYFKKYQINVNVKDKKRQIINNTDDIITK